MYQDRAVGGPVLWVAVWASGPARLQRRGGILVARDHGCIRAVLVSYPRAAVQEVGRR